MNLHQDTKPEQAFYCADGSILKNLSELAEKLRKISKDAYNHHVNGCRNDFYNWIKDVYGNEKLAKEVAFAGSSKEAARIIEKALAPNHLRKKKPAERKKVVVAKRKRTKKRRKPAKKIRKAAVVAATAKKKEKKKSTEKAKRRRKTRRKPANRKIMLHKRIHRHLKRLARRYFLIKCQNFPSVFD